MFGAVEKLDIDEPKIRQARAWIAGKAGWINENTACGFVATRFRYDERLENNELTRS